MSKEFFRLKGRREKLLAAMAAAEGAPFIEGAAGPHGYDCAHFVLHLWRESGGDVDQVGELPKISLDHGRHHEGNPLRDFILGNEYFKKRLRRLDEDEPAQIGDLVFVKQHRGELHMGVAESSLVWWHVPRQGRVCRETLHKYRRYRVTRYRFLEIEEEPQ